MATAVLVHAGANRLRYLLTSEGTNAETVNISTIGSATPDTLTDSLASGVIKALSKVVANGYGSFAAGAQTSVKANALWNSNLVGADPSSGSPAGSKLATAKMVVTRRSGNTARWQAFAQVSAGNPILTIAISGQVAGETAYLDVESPNTIGL